MTVTLTEKMLNLCFSKPLTGLKTLFDEAYTLRLKNFPNEMHFYIPSMAQYQTSIYKTKNNTSFPAISLTGTRCQLNCEHCKKTLLKNMIPATNPQELFAVCSRIKQLGGQGCLISGGSQKDGGVPLSEFISTIGRVKTELGLEIVVHTGLVTPPLAKALAEAHIDAAMLDIMGTEETMKEVYHLEGSVDAFRHSLTSLRKNNIPTVPHILVGIHYGQLKGEKRAIQIISQTDPAAVVVVALRPLKDTPMEKIDPPPPSDVARVILACRMAMPNKPILLGCARPGGLHRTETDELAIKAGINGIAYPSEEAIQSAATKGFRSVFHEECCSLNWQIQ